MPDFTVNTVASGQQLTPAVATFPSGLLVVVWEDDKDNNGYYQILARIFNEIGTELVPDFTVNTVASGQQRNPAVATFPSGLLVVVWEDDKDNNGYYQILAKMLTEVGSDLPPVPAIRIKGK